MCGPCAFKTPEKARFAADKAERRDDDITVFDKGVYTTCEPCRENPKKSPLWQIKASRIIYNSTDRMVYYKAAKFEFMGVPLLYTPYLAHPDPSRKRSSGLLAPRGGYNSELGTYVTPRYYWAPSESYDVTFSPTYYSKQGLLGNATWRQHVGIGTYNIRVAGISQQDKGSFSGTAETKPSAAPRKCRPAEPFPTNGISAGMYLCSLTSSFCAIMI